MALAKNLSEQIDDQDMQRSWSKVKSGPKRLREPTDALRAIAPPTIEPSPLDNLPDEARLTAETILDNQPEPTSVRSERPLQEGDLVTWDQNGEPQTGTIQYITASENEAAIRHHRHGVIGGVPILRETYVPLDRLRLANPETPNPEPETTPVRSSEPNSGASNSSDGASEPKTRSAKTKAPLRLVKPDPSPKPEAENDDAFTPESIAKLFGGLFGDVKASDFFIVGGGNED